MHPDQRALLNGIIAEPERDDLRLIYCDWLEEREEAADCNRCNGKGFLLTGTPPAPLRTRMTCPVCNGTCRVSNGMAARAKEIREQCENHSIMTREWLKNPSVMLVRQRGFLFCVYCPMEWWIKNGPAACVQDPLTHVEITDKAPTQRGFHSGHVWQFGFGELSEMSEWVIPICLDDREPMLGMDVFVGYFNTVQPAKDWLSARSIAWARDQAATTSAS